ncbi:MAG: hypothetical protein LBB21_00185 [Holosporaceae bacterium]|jgi:hypothetical protein|nr:hypothetical protein [Holosporaceae bacterium]
MNRFLSYVLSKKTLLIASFCFMHVVHSIDGKAILEKLNNLKINSHFLLHSYLGNNNLYFIKKAYDIDENFRRLVSQEKYGKKCEFDLSVATKIALDKVCEEFFRAQRFHARIAQILAAATNVEFVNGPKDGAIDEYNYSFLQLTIKKVRDILLESDPLMFMDEGFGDFLSQLDGSPLQGRITDQVRGIVHEYRGGVPEPSPSDPPPPLIVRLDQPEAASAQLAEFCRMQDEIT